MRPHCKAAKRFRAAESSAADWPEPVEDPLIWEREELRTGPLPAFGRFEWPAAVTVGGRLVAALEDTTVARYELHAHAKNPEGPR